MSTYVLTFQGGSQWNYQSNVDPEELFRTIFGKGVYITYNILWWGVGCGMIFFSNVLYYYMSRTYIFTSVHKKTINIYILFRAI